MKRAFIKRLTVVAMAAAIVGTTVAPVVSEPTTVEAATKKQTKAKLKKARFKASAISLSEGGNVIWVNGVKLAANKKLTVKINGKKAAIDHIGRWNDEGQWVTQIYLKSDLDSGKYKIQIQEKGYKAVTKTVEYESIAGKFVVNDSFVREMEGENVICVFLNRNVDAEKVTCMVDGADVAVKTSFVSGDGVLVMWYDASNLDSGEHTITLSCEGYETYTGTFSGEVLSN